jgi:UDP-2-acetamido-2-deoxy-ribo-hexuluronate aminotransferase
MGLFKNNVQIEFRDLKTQYKKYRSKINKDLKHVMNESNFILGSQVQLLERELADFVGVNHAVTCANGTDAMTLVLMAWGIGPNDAVFVPNFTFFATAEVVSLQGATPVFVDVDLDSFNIDIISLEHQILRVINEGKLNPKAIIPVDLFGLPANYEAIDSIAKKYNLLVLEDAAQGFGGSYNNKMACSFGDAATTSFYPAKPLGCYGDGGAIFTNSDELAKTLRSLRAHGIGSHRYDNVQIGLNSRLDTIQAVILRVKLNALKRHELNDVNKAAHKYNILLRDIVKTPYIGNDFYSSYAQYTIQTRDESERNGLIEYLKKHNIPTMVYYPKTLSQQKAYQHLNFNEDDYANSIQLTRTSLSLPIHPYLKDKHIRYITNAIKDYFD